MTWKHAGFSVLIASLLLSMIGRDSLAADKPRLPAERTTDAAPEGKVRLGGVIDFVPPADWTVAAKAGTPTRAAYVSADRQCMIAVEVLPATMKIEPSLVPDMIRKMRQNRQANGQKFVQEPTAEKDENFVIRIRERFGIKDKVADQLHLYRAVGPRFVLVTVNSLGGEDAAKAHHEAGVAIGMSAELVKPAK